MLSASAGIPSRRKEEKALPNYCTVTVHYMDGVTEQYYGGIYINDSILRIWPQKGTSCAIPLCNIRKIETKS